MYSVLQSRTYLAWVTLALLISLNVALRLEPGAEPVYAGFCYTASAPLDSPSSDQSLRAIREQTGATHIEIVVERFQTYLNSTSISAPVVPVSNSTQLLHAIRTIDSLGMQAVLKPHVECDCGVWRANIKMESAADWDAWFNSYTPYVVEMAQISQQQHLPALNIGTELGGTTGQEQHWRELIKQVRAVYSGKLWYGANWGAYIWEVAWFDAVDYIGCDAYYPLSKLPDPSLSQIKQGWKPVLANLSALSEKWNGKQIVLAEIGYCSRTGAASSPAGPKGDGVNLALQTRLYEAFFQEAWVASWFAGTFFWAWSSQVLSGGSCDEGFTLAGKPAAAVCKQHFGHRFLDHVLKREHQRDRQQLVATIYSDGVLGDGWTADSWDGNFTPTSKDLPLFPGHTVSYKGVMQLWGAISFGTNEITLPPSRATAALEFFIRADSPLDAINIGIEVDDVILPQLSLSHYLPIAYNCSLPSKWSPAPVSVPLSVMLAGSELANGSSVRFNLKNSHQDDDIVYVDNVSLIATRSTTTLQIDVSAVIASTRDEYVSYNIDSTENRNYFERNLSNPRLASFAKELSPAFMRIGGSGANILYYQFGDDADKQHPARYVWHWKQWTVANASAKYLEPALWESVCKLSVAAGAKLVLNVNMIQFAEDGGHNMKQLLKWTIGRGYRIYHIEPSNELGTPPASVLQGMHRLLVELYPDEETRPGLIGSDDGECPPCADLMRAQCKNASVPLFAANYHKYSDCEKVLAPQDVKNISAFSYADGAETWIGEAASCGSGGHLGVSDTFASGFWYMQHLGRLAQLNHRVFLRQSLIGGNYGLLRDRFWDTNLTGAAVLPNTDYFVAVLFKRQMGNDVFATQHSTDGKVLTFAHCAREHSTGGLSVALINFDTSVRSASVRLAGGGSLVGERVEYILTAAGGERGGVYSRFAQLNGRGIPLAAAEDLAVGAKPGNGATVVLPPQSFGIVVWPSAGVALCGGASY